MKGNRPGLWRGVAIAALLTLVGAAVGGVALRGAAKRYAVRLLTRTVEGHFGELYRVAVGGVSLHPLSGRVRVEGIDIHPRRDAAESLRAEGRIPAELYDLHIGGVEATLVAPVRNFLRRRVHFRRVFVDSPSIGVTSLREGGVRGAHTFRSPFHSILLRGIDVRGGRFTYLRVRERDTLRVAIEDMDVKAGEIRLDSLIDTRRSPAIKGLEFITGRVSLSPAGEGLALSAGGVRGAVDRGSAEIDSLRLDPVYSQREFPARTRGGDWVRLRSGRISLAGFDFRGAADGCGLLADSLTVRGLVLESFKNRREKVAPSEKPLLYRVLRDIPIPFHIATARLTDGTLVYGELPPDGATEGRFFMDGLSLGLAPLTNDVTCAGSLDIRAVARVMGRGRAEMDVTLPVGGDDGRFSIRASVDSMPLKALEAATGPLAHIGVRSGRLHALRMNVEGDAHGGTVDMTMEYDSLSVTLFNRAGFRSAVGSAFANALIVEDSNPLPGQPVRRVRGAAQRDPYRSEFNYWWRIVLDGVKQSVGFTPEAQRRVTSLQKTLGRLRERGERRRATRREKERE